MGEGDEGDVLNDAGDGGATAGAAAAQATSAVDPETRKAARARRMREAHLTVATFSRAEASDELAMNILVVGASQGTGALAVGAALAKGHHVSAFARSPQKLVLEHPKLRRIVGDFHQPASVDAAVPGHDAVIVTASATSLSSFKGNPRYFSQGTAYVIDAMTRAGVKRLSVLSALGTGESAPLLNPLVRLLGPNLFLRVPFEDHQRQEALVRNSGLEWIVARPGRLTNGPARHRYVAKTGLEKVPGSIARADVAEFLVEACVQATWIGQAVQLGG